MTPPILFISYSRLDRTAKDALLEELAPLRRDCVIDEAWTDDQIKPGAEWYTQLRDAMERASVAVCLLSGNYVASAFCMTEELPVLRRRQQRGEIVLLPLLLGPLSDWGSLVWIRTLQVIDATGSTKDAFEELARTVARVVLDPLHRPATPPPRPYEPRSVDLDRLAASGTCIGREAELDQLRRLWRGGPVANAVALFGEGGIGKTSLVRGWLDEMDAGGFAGADWVLGWTFRSGVVDDRSQSPDAFLDYALRALDESPVATPWRRAQQLLSALRSERTLLVLDGVESLLSPSGDGTGRLRDRSLHALVTGLAAENPGLCVLTTRMRIGDLDPYERAPQMDVSQLDPADGAKLLLECGLTGRRSEREQLSRSCRHHALTLRLLAGYLRTCPPTAWRTRVDHLVGERACVTVEALLTALDAQLGGGTTAALLRVLALVGRPTTLADLRALLANPEMQRLHPQLTALPSTRIGDALEEMRELGLAEVMRRDGNRRVELHALVGDFFTAAGERKDPEAWRGTHGVVCARLLEASPSRADSIEDQIKLAACVRHTCAAGEYESAYAVYLSRMEHGPNQHYLTKSLCAMGTALSALSGFFEKPWRAVERGVPAQLARQVLLDTALCLEAEGRLAEAAEALEAVLLLEEDSESMFDQLRVVDSLCSLGLIRASLGQLDGADETLARAIECAAHRSHNEREIERVRVHCAETRALGGKPYLNLPPGVSQEVWDQLAQLAGRLKIMRGWAAAFHATVLQAQGASERAMEEFRRAEGAQATAEFPFLYSLPGYYHQRFLIDHGQFEDAHLRATASLRLAESQGLRLDVGWAKLALALAKLRGEKADAEGLPSAARLVDEALDTLVQANQWDGIVDAMVACATVERCLGHPLDARRLLDEALALARHARMRTSAVDVELEYARLLLSLDAHAAARERLSACRTAIEGLGYGRGRARLEALETLAALS